LGRKEHSVCALATKASAQDENTWEHDKAVRHRQLRILLEFSPNHSLTGTGM